MIHSHAVSLAREIDATDSLDFGITAFLIRFSLLILVQIAAVILCVTAAVPIIWQDLMSCENTFPSRAHALCRWYGVRDFVVVMAAPNMEDIVSENRINMLLSSFAIAANNTSWYGICRMLQLTSVLQFQPLVLTGNQCHLFF